MQNKPQRRMKLGIIPSIDEASVNGQTPRFRDLQVIAQTAEQIGLDSLWLADHLIFRFPNQDEQGCWEVFTFLSGLAAVTSTIQLGPLVACTSFRNPALIAKMADSLDEISNGRFILGLGAGWHEPEYQAFGYPFDHRASRFEEALQIILPLLREGHVDFEGKYYQARNAVLRPRGPSPNGPKIWSGTSGPRLLELTARYADAWNQTAWRFRADHLADRHARLLEACEKVGRDPATIELTAATQVHFRPATNPNETGIYGSAEQIAEALREYADIGVTHLIVDIDPGTLEGVEQFARVVEVLDQG